jgi:hypothetical protein
VGKIANGGSSSMHELEGLDPKTLQSKFAGVWQRLVNEPTSANAGAFTKQYTDYADALTKDAQKVISDKYGRIIQTNKDRLAPEAQKHLEDNYLNRFKPEVATAKVNESPQQKSGKPASDTGFPKKVINAQTGHQATVSNAKELQEANARGFQ